MLLDAASVRALAMATRCRLHQLAIIRISNEMCIGSSGESVLYIRAWLCGSMSMMHEWSCCMLAPTVGGAVRYVNYCACLHAAWDRVTCVCSSSCRWSMKHDRIVLKRYSSLVLAVVRQLRTTMSHSAGPHDTTHWEYVQHW